MEKLVPQITDNQRINEHRAAVEHRATWMYLMLEEATERGLSPDFAREAIGRCGCIQKLARMEDCPDFESFMRASMNELVNQAWEQEIKWGEDEVFVENHYCPLVAAWQKLTDDDKKLAELCDIAMDGDRGLFAEPLMNFELIRTLGEGAPTCQMRFTKLKK